MYYIIEDKRKKKTNQKIHNTKTQRTTSKIRPFEEKEKKLNIVLFIQEFTLAPLSADEGIFQCAHVKFKQSRDLIDKWSRTQQGIFNSFHYSVKYHEQN